MGFCLWISLGQWHVANHLCGEPDQWSNKVSWCHCSTLRDHLWGWSSMLTGQVGDTSQRHSLNVSAMLWKAKHPQTSLQSARDLCQPAGQLPRANPVSKQACCARSSKSLFALLPAFIKNKCIYPLWTRVLATPKSTDPSHHNRNGDPKLNTFTSPWLEGGHTGKMGPYTIVIKWRYNPQQMGLTYWV